jgi:hypothetical protein
MQNGKDHMHAFGRPPGLVQNGHSHVVVTAASPPLSPGGGSSPRLRSGRSLGRGSRDVKVKFGSPGVKGGRHPSTFLQKLTLFLLSFFLRRHRVLLLIPFIYVTGMMLFMGADLSMPEFPPFPGRYRPGSIYRSDQVFAKLWPEMESAEASSYGVSTQLPPALPSTFTVSWDSPETKSWGTFTQDL